MKVQISLSAVEDLQNILNWYESQLATDVGLQMVAEILVRTETLADHPDIGRVVPEFSNDNIRELIHPPFRVVYLREKSLISVVRIWRSERILQLS